MDNATFRLKHSASDSLALIEFAWKDNQAEIIYFSFIKGNVVDLAELRRIKKYATNLFIKEVKQGILR